MEYEREISDISFSLIDRFHFKVDVTTNEFDDIIKSVNTMIQINETTWTSELRNYYELVQKLEHLPLRIEKLINPLIKTFESGLIGKEESSLIKDNNSLKERIDPTITAKLLPFQWQGIRHSIQQGGRILIVIEIILVLFF